MSNVVHVYAIVAIIIVIKSNYNECDECKPSLNSCNVGASTICSGRLFQIFNVSGKNEYSRTPSCNPTVQKLESYNHHCLLGPSMLSQ